jgi:hypothetical protein
MSTGENYGAKMLKKLAHCGKQLECGRRLNGSHQITDVTLSGRYKCGIFCIAELAH